MRVTQLRMTNIGRFAQLDVALARSDAPSNIKVFIGDNGSGKTSLLKSLATALSWYVARLRSESGSGNPILEEAIKNGAAYASVEIEVEDCFEPSMENNTYRWSLVKARAGRKADKPAQLVRATELANNAT